MSITTVKTPIALIATFVWIGFVCAISFMEAWLKFQAPGITLALGLGIGRIVFAALNKVEWILALAIFINLLVTRNPLLTFPNSTFFVTLLLLIIQTWWLLPELDTRAIMHIEGKNIPPSNLHFYYVAMEALKVTCLTVFGISQFKTIKS